MNSSTKASCFTNTAAEKIVKVSAYSLVALIGLLGNSLICFIFWKSKNLRRTINYFILNMAVSDLLVPIFAISRKIKEVFTTEWLVLGAPGAFLCKVSFFAPDVSFVVSILSLLFMAFERFLAIVFPMKTSVIMGTPSRMVLIALTWIAAIAVNASYFYTFRLIKMESNVTICVSTWEPALDNASTQRKYGIASFTIFVIAPFSLLVIFYTSIAIAIRKQKITLENFACEGITERVRRDRENRAVTTLSAAVVGGFAICCVPFNAYVFCRIFGLKLSNSTSCRSVTFFFIADFLVKSASVVNPCTCFVFYQSYRRSLRDLFQSFFEILSKSCSARPRERVPPCALLELREIR